MELRFDEEFSEMNIEQHFEKIVEIKFRRFVKEVFGSALKLFKSILISKRCPFITCYFDQNQKFNVPMSCNCEYIYSRRFLEVIPM